MTPDPTDIDWLDALLARTATAEIMVRFRRLGVGDVREKTSAIDLVTEADVNAERVITRALRDRFPNALVVGEEAHAEDPAVLDGLAGAELAFVLDPVDGTYNFAAGLPLFGVMLAVVRKGETVAAIIHDPVGRQSLQAVKGAGAWLKDEAGSPAPCRVAPAGPLGEMTGAVAWHFLPEPLRTRLAANQARFRAPFNYRCAAYEYRLLATGYAHFVLFTKLMPWDHLPGVLIHGEAGGHVGKIDGTPYRPGDTEGALLAAPDAASWQAIRAALYDG